MRATRRALATTVVVLAAFAWVAAPTFAAIPAAASYQATITGAVYEWNSLVGGYQQTAAVNLPALLFIEPRRTAPRPTSPVVGLFTGPTPALDNRPGAINFATNTQGFHVNPNFVVPTRAAIDVAVVQADPAAGVLQAQVDTNTARTVTVELFRTSASFISAPAQILVGTLGLQFSPDGSTVTGSFDLAGNGLIEPGNPLFPVRRYVADLNGQATSLTPDQGAGGGGDAGGGGGGGGGAGGGAGGGGAAGGGPTVAQVIASIAQETVQSARALEKCGTTGLLKKAGCADSFTALKQGTVGYQVTAPAAAGRSAAAAAIAIASARKAIPAAGTYPLKIKATKKGRSRLKKTRKLRAKLTVRFTDSDGNVATKSKKIVLKRKQK